MIEKNTTIHGRRGILRRSYERSRENCAAQQNDRGLRIGNVNSDRGAMQPSMLSRDISLVDDSAVATESPVPVKVWGANGSWFSRPGSRPGPCAGFHDLSQCGLCCCAIYLGLELGAFP